MPSLEAAALIYDIANTYQFYSSIIILVIGIISNIFIILIFTTLRTFRGNQCAYYLKIESITDIGLLLAILPSDIASYTLGQNPSQLSLIWCKLKYMCSYGCGIYSLSTICFLAFDQYLSTNHRPNWRQLSTITLAHRVTFFNIGLALLHGILFLVFAEIGASGCAIYNPTLKIYFTFFYLPILSGFLPMVISTFFSFLAYQNVRRIVRRQVPLERRQLDHQMTAMALARVICIFILGVPFLVLSLLRFTTGYNNVNYAGKAVITLSLVFTDSLLYSNYSVS
jgi:hypothetical protein